MMVQREHLERRPHRIDNPRSAKSAAQRRGVRSVRGRYAGIAQVTFTLAIVSVMLLGYVMLTSNLTGLTYAVNRAHAQREALLEETARLDDKLEALSSDRRLASIAAKLGMKDPQRFGVISPPASSIMPHLALLTSH